MRGRFLILVVLSLVGSAVIASAGDGGKAAKGEPAVSAARALRLPASGCVRTGHVRVSVAPPAGGTFAVLTVRADDDEILQLSGLGGAGMLSVTLPAGATRIDASATTSGGQFLQTARTYRRCAARRELRRRPPAPRPKAPQIIEEGGGED